MGFSSGTVSFRRFAVIGASPKSIDQDLLDKLEANALRENDISAVEEDYGWSGGRHVLDGAFNFENNVFADAIHVALRIDTNKVPAELKKAYQIMEEEAAAQSNPSGFISRNQKRDAREIARRRIEEDVRSGKFRRSKLLPVLWDVPGATVYCSASAAAAEKLMELFQRTFELELAPMSAGASALRLLEPRGKRRDYEDLRPTRFTAGTDGEHQQPDYPWTAKGDAPKDFLGNEFLVWLWHAIDAGSGAIETSSGEVTAFFDRALDLECAYGQTGKTWLRGDAVARMPEAIDALRTGKVPRKAGLTLEASGVTYGLGIQAESLSISSLKLPEVEEADSARVLFEERIAMLRQFGKTLEALFATFLDGRASSGWEGQTSSLRRWISRSPRPVAALA
jgi:hypothetical protein